MNESLFDLQKFEYQLIIKPSDITMKEQFKIQSKKITKIGRNQQNHIAIMEDSISRYRAKIFFEKNNFQIM